MTNFPNGVWSLLRNEGLNTLGRQAGQTGSVAAPASTLEQRQELEINFWRDSALESPEADALETLIDKVRDAQILLDCLERYCGLLKPGRVLELGGGQGWASCVYKRRFPEAQVVLTDISEYAVASAHKWEKLFGVRFDECHTCRSYETRESAGAVDVIFCFAAAHHFAAHRRTLREIHRILAPGGTAFYFYEPACTRFLHRLAHRRVNSKRPNVPEDVLIYRKVLALAKEAGLRGRVDFYPSLLKRGRVEWLYYFALNVLPPLQRLLPCTANFVFTK